MSTITTSQSGSTGRFCVDTAFVFNGWEPTDDAAGLHVNVNIHNGTDAHQPQ
jgi:hypothetical protein